MKLFTALSIETGYCSSAYCDLRRRQLTIRRNAVIVTDRLDIIISTPYAPRLRLSVAHQNLPGLAANGPGRQRAGPSTGRAGSLFNLFSTGRVGPGRAPNEPVQFLLPGPAHK
jgi:hypothetical protein